MKPTRDEALEQAVDEILSPSDEEWVEIWDKEEDILLRR